MTIQGRVPVEMDESQIRELEEIVGNKHVLSSEEDLISYSFDGTFTESRPDVVVQPLSTEQVAGVMSLADRYEIPVIPRGMASGLAGGSVPIGGGIGKIFNIGSQAINDQLHYYYNAEKPDIVGDSSIRLHLQFMFPR